MVRGFITGTLLAALLLGLLWCVSAMAQQQYYNNVPVNGLIATVSGSNVSSLQFTTSNGTWSNNYNSLYLNCTGLTVTTSGDCIMLWVGESAAGWLTTTYINNIGGTYVNGDQGIVNGTAQNIINGGGCINCTDPVCSTEAMSLTTTTYAYIQATVSNLGSSTAHKVFSGVMGGSAGADIDYDSNITYGAFSDFYGWWAGDTNPLNGIELVPYSGGTMSGTCSLYGVP